MPKTPLFIRAAMVAMLLALACGEPLGLEPLLWRFAAETNTGYGLGFLMQGVGPEGLYGTCYVNERMRRLVVYGGGAFRLDYETPGDDEDIDSVAFYGDRGWLSGSVGGTGSDPGTAFLVNYENGEWSENRKAFPNIVSLDSITPAGPDKFYCIATLPGFTQKRYISAYSGDSLDIFYGAGQNQTFAYAKDTRTIFAITYGKEGPQVVASGDGGATWAWENIAVPPGFKIKQVFGFTASPEALYITTKLETGEQTWYAIIKRTGRPGEGIYEFSYMGATGPGRGMISECAFRTDADGVATGLGGTLHLNTSGWTAELCGEADEFGELTPDPRGGYWAIGNNGGLYRHP